jgi:hypothetical protein
LPARTAAPSAAAAAKISCGTQVVGVTNNRTLILRDLNNDAIVGEKTATRALPFKPSSMALAWAKDTQRGYNLGVRTINPHGRPTILTVKAVDGRPHVTYTSDRMLNRSFSPRAFAGSASFYVFTTTRGVVKRWTSYHNRRGQLFYDDPVVVTKNAPAMATLSYALRKRVDGARSDILWGTTKSGALVQMRVPVTHPDRAKIIVVKRRGFAEVTGLSLSFCGGHAASLSIMAISKSNNNATWYTLKKQFSPRATNLTKHGLAGVGANWRLNATF